MSWAEAAPVRPAGPPKFDAAAFASQGLRPEECEAEARRYLSEAADHGWKALKICAKNRNFTLLRHLLSEAWLEQLNARDDATALIARVIANRGGSVDRDVQLLTGHRFPLFAFGAAMAQPETYNGRMVLMRAKISDIRTQGAATTVKLAEYSLGSSDYEVATAPKTKWTNNRSYERSSTSSASAKASVNTSKYGSATASGSYEGKRRSEGKGSSTSVKETTETKWDNFANETGREALGRLPKPDPFLTPDKEFVILARFDGTRRMDNGEESTSVGVLAVLAYFEPNALVVY